MTLDGAAEYYKYLSGKEMPYQFSTSSTGLVDKGSWISCAEKDENEDNNGNDNNDDDEVIEMCEEAYQGAARCETNMTHLTYPDTSGCTYISQIKAAGTVAYQATGSGSGKSFAAFFFIFGGFVVLAGLFVATKRKSSSSKSAPLVEVEMTSD